MTATEQQTDWGRGDKPASSEEWGQGDKPVHSIIERAAANLPKSLVKNSPLNVMPGFGDSGLDSEGHMKPPLQTLQETGRMLLHPVDTFKEMFANDPIGALQPLAMGLEGMTNAGVSGAQKLRNAAKATEIGAPEAIAAGTGHLHAAALLYARKLLSNMMGPEEVAPASKVPVSPVDSTTGEVLKPLPNGEFMAPAKPAAPVSASVPPEVASAPAVRPTASVSPTPEATPTPIDESNGVHGGVENTPVAKKSVEEWLDELRQKMKDKGISMESQGNPQASWDEGSGSPVVNSALRKSYSTAEIANPDLVRNGIVKAAKPGTALADPKVVDSALKLYNELNRSGVKITVGDLMKRITQ